MSTYTVSDTETFTIANARNLASKVATDLKKFQRFYANGPTDEWIDKYERELVVLLKYRVLDNVVYGFKRNDRWTEASVKYTMLPDGSLSTTDDPGKIRPGLDVSGAHFTSYLITKKAHLSASDRTAMERELPFDRVGMEAPNLESGQWVPDLNYASGGRGIGRMTVKK